MNKETASDSHFIYGPHFIRRLFFLCLLIEIVLLFLDLFFNYGEFFSSRKMRRIVNLAREDGVGTWFSVSQTLLVGLTLTVIFSLQKKWRGWRSAFGWGILALFFFYMSMDDGSKIHERVSSHASKKAIALMQDTFLQPVATFFEKFPSYSWQLIFGPFFILMGLYLLWFLWKKFDQTKLKVLLLAGLSLLGLAMALDFVEGLDDVYKNLATAWEVRPYTVRHFSKITEEFLEMFATTLLWVAFLKYLFSKFHGTSFTLKDK